MKAIDKATARIWCAVHGFAWGDRDLPVQCGPEEFTIPQDAGARIALVREHLVPFRNEEEVLILIDDWAVWPSGQWMHTFDRFRLSYGISESLIERPGHIVSKEEFDPATSIAKYAVLMLWDCYILGSSGRTFLYYSHDESGNKK